MKLIGPAASATGRMSQEEPLKLRWEGAGGRVLCQAWSNVDQKRKTSARTRRSDHIRNSRSDLGVKNASRIRERQHVELRGHIVIPSDSPSLPPGCPPSLAPALPPSRPPATCPPCSHARSAHTLSHPLPQGPPPPRSLVPHAHTHAHARTRTHTSVLVPPSIGRST